MAPTSEQEKATPSSFNAQQDQKDERDIAITIVGEHRQYIDPSVEARVVHKIDRFLVPAMIVGYGLVYYDKASPSPPLRFYI
jgi:hypothetical protein